MSKSLQVMESLQGELVNITTLDRLENEYYGEMLEFSIEGPTVKYSDHGREFIEFIPMRNINSISHKVLSK